MTAINVQRSPIRKSDADQDLPNHLGGEPQEGEAAAIDAAAAVVGKANVQGAGGGSGSTAVSAAGKGAQGKGGTGGQGQGQGGGQGNN